MAGLTGISRQDYERLVAAVGTAGMGQALLTAAHALSIDEVFAFVSTGQAPPRPLASSGAHAAFERRVRLYADRFHPFDPLLHALRQADAGETDLVRRVRAQDIQDSDYRRECFETPRLCEKFSLAQRRSGTWCVLSLYRRVGREQASEENLIGFCQVVAPLLARHGELAGEADLPLMEKVERGLALHYPSLTARERAVCARTLVGMTAEAIGLDLDISRSTVLTYRRRAYERLNISAANQLIARLLS